MAIVWMASNAMNTWIRTDGQIMHMCVCVITSWVVGMTWMYIHLILSFTYLFLCRSLMMKLYFALLWKGLLTHQIISSVTQHDHKVLLFAISHRVSSLTKTEHSPSIPLKGLSVSWWPVLWYSLWWDNGKTGGNSSEKCPRKRIYKTPNSDL